MKIIAGDLLKPARDWLHRRLRRRKAPHGGILMYHRIASPTVDPWKLCVSPEHFAGQMQQLRAIADVVPLNELPSRLQAGRNSRPVVAITFDDAYLDNLTHAKPVLAQVAAPATIFVPTGWVGSSEPIWWDLLAHIVLTSAKLPDVLELDGPFLSIRWRNTAIPGSSAQPLASRRELHINLWRQLRRLDDKSRSAAMHQLLNRFGADPATLRDVRVMTRDELADLTRDGLLTLGSHAVSHPSLPSLDSASKAWEIEHSARQFEQLTGKRPTSFAFPYGEVDAESVMLVSKSGYRLACSVQEDLVWEDSDPLQLPRLGVGNWSAREFKARLKHYWFA
jgi:peptidoglycan/xylan/chitin deacetylase (PgdA/CDA1 family)